MTKLLSVASLTLLLLILPREHPDRASLSGHITDDNLVPIADATVSIRNVSYGEVDTTRTNATGAYDFTHLRQGRYSMFIEAAGYCSRSVFNVILFREQRTELDLILNRSRERIHQAPAQKEPSMRTRKCSYVYFE